MTQSPESARRFERFKGRFKVAFTSKTSSMVGEVLNFSESGLFIQADHLPAPGEPLELICQLGKMGSIAVRGNVVWKRERSFNTTQEPEARGFGVSLLSPPDEYIAFVRKFKDYVERGRSRTHERIDISHRVTFQSGFEFLTEYCENLSHGGLYLATQKPLAPESIINFTLDIPGTEQPLPLEGKVLYALPEKEALEKGHKAGVGVQFVNLSPEATSKLQHFIRRLQLHRQSRNFGARRDLPPEGALHDFLMPEILIHLFETQWTGILRLNLRGLEKVVYIKSGKPFYVDSPLIHETFGRHLVRMGVIEESTMLEISEELTRQDFKFGEILLQKKLIDPATLSQYLVNHQEEKLSHTLQYFDGRYALEPKSDWPMGISFFPIRLFHVLFSGAHHWYDETLVQTWFGIDDATLLKSHRSLPSGIEIPSFCLRMFNLMRQPQSVSDLSEKLKTTHDNIYPVLFILILAGWIGKTHGVSTEKTATPPKESKIPPQDLQRLREQIATDYELISKLDFFELFDIKPNDSIYGIDIKYFKWIEVYDVAKLSQLHETEWVDKANMVLSTIKMAFETIKDPYLRQLYVRRNASSPKGKRREEYFQSDLLYITGVSLLEQKKMDELMQLLTSKFDLVQKDPSILGLYAWALFQSKGGESYKESIDYLEQAILRNPADAQLRYFRGKMYEFNKYYDLAIEDYTKSVALQPNFMQAEAAKDHLLQKQNLHKNVVKKRKK